MSGRSSRCRYAVQNYLRSGTRPMPGATLMCRAMRGLEDVGTLAHVNFEPGDVVPSRGDMGRLVERMESQQLIIGALHWVLENEAWLRHATLRLAFDAPGAEVGGYELIWHEKVGRARYEGARREIPQLCELLRSRRATGSPRYVRIGLTVAMNEVGWCPDRALEALGTFASPLSQEEGRDWIERHRQAHQLSILQARTVSAPSASSSRRL